MHTLYTIGHSNHPIATFVEWLADFGVQAVADVRSHPRSRFVPHFDRAPLSASLRDSGIAYVFLGRELGARHRGGDPAQRAAAFARGLARVRRGLDTTTIALMCAERDPLACHRTLLLARALKRDVPDIRHIVDRRRFETHGETEQRLLRGSRSAEPDLFLSAEERLDDAYRQRGGAIAPGADP